MRIITGDECGLLKEVIPELCRPSTTSSNNNIHAGKARPSATSIQAAASSYGTTNVEGGNNQQNGIQRIETGHNIQSRERGIISLSFLPPPSNSSTEQSSEFNFAALRTNGIVETWNGTRITNNNDDEVNVTSARYKKYDGLVKGILPDQQQSSSNNEEEKDVSGSNNEDKETNQEKKSTTNTGWYANQPIRPIGMVSNYSPSSSFTTNPILATCDSIGTISLINTNKLSEGVISSYNAFDIDTSSSSTTNNNNSLPTPSSSKNNSNSIGTLTYTRGRYANVSIATSIAIDNSSGGGECKLAVGGRERGVRVLDLETGKLLWKAKNLPPDPQTLLQQPMWTTSIQFLHTPTSAISTDSPSNLLATGSAYKQVQIYDIRVSSSGGGGATSTRRPVLYTPDELLSHRITSMCQLNNNNGNTIAVGDTIGDVHLLDMRKMHSGKPSHRNRYNNNTSSSKHKAKEEIGLGRLVGPGGSINQLYIHPTLPILSCVGLDRKLWTYDVNRHKMIDCIYLKQRLNCMLVCDDESWNVTNDEDEIDEEENGSSMNVDDDLEVEDEVEDYVNSDDEDEEGEVDNGQVAEKEESKSGSSGSSGSSSSGEDETESESGSGSEEEEENVVSKKRRTK